jgi:topoisomerase IA-like protein
MWMIKGSLRTLDKLPKLSGSHAQQSEVLRTMIGAYGPHNLGGSATEVA